MIGRADPCRSQERAITAQGDEEIHIGQVIGDAASIPGGFLPNLGQTQVTEKAFNLLGQRNRVRRKRGMALWLFVAAVAAAWVGSTGVGLLAVMICLPQFPCRVSLLSIIDQPVHSVKWAGSPQSRVRSPASRPRT